LPSLVNNKQQLILKQVKGLNKVYMAASADTDQLGKQLQGVSLKWVVSRLPVVALFGNQQEQQHVGEPFVRNAQSDLPRLLVEADISFDPPPFHFDNRLSMSSRQ
jgi:hypothetical protein